MSKKTVLITVYTRVILPLHLFLLPSHWPPVRWRPSCAWSADRMKHSWKMTLDLFFLNKHWFYIFRILHLFSFIIKCYSFLPSVQTESKLISPIMKPWVDFSPCSEQVVTVVRNASTHYASTHPNRWLQLFISYISYGWQDFPLMFPYWGSFTPSSS